MDPDILKYNENQEADDKDVCDVPAKAIDSH